MLQEQGSFLHRIGKALRAQSEDIAHEPLPKRWVDLIHYLDEQERKRAEGLEAKKEPRDRQ
jgi:hypothetical protein